VSAPNQADLYPLTTRLVRLTLGALVVIDVVLGGIAVFWPRLYMDWVHPGAPDDPRYLLQRSGMIWLGYLAVQVLALIRLKRTPEWVLSVAILRLIEVPADILYLFVGTGIGSWGTIGLTVTPIFNAVVGLFLAGWYFCCGKRLSQSTQAQPSSSR
jgi:hypothetical protein